MTENGELWTGAIGAKAVAISLIYLAGRFREIASSKFSKALHYTSQAPRNDRVLKFNDSIFNVECSPHHLVLVTKVLLRNAILEAPASSSGPVAPITTSPKSSPSQGEDFSIYYEPVIARPSAKQRPWQSL